MGQDRSKIKQSYFSALSTLLKHTPLLPFIFIIEKILGAKTKPSSYVLPIIANFIGFVILINMMTIPYIETVEVSRKILNLDRDQRRTDGGIGGVDFNQPDRGSIIDSVIEGIVDTQTRDMLKDYLNAVHLASRSQGEGIIVPPWYIIGLQVLENSGLYQKSPPIPRASIPADLYGKTRSDGSIMNFVTWGIDDVRVHGDGSGSNWSSSAVKGPFQFKDGTWTSNGMDGNGDGKKDVFNLYDSMFGAARYATANYNNIKGKVNVQDDDLYWMWAAMAHNAGQGGTHARVPDDVKLEFMGDLAKIKSNKDAMSATFEHYMQSGRGWGMRAKFMGEFDKLGYSMSPQLASRLQSNGVTLTQSTRTFNGWAGSTAGSRNNPWRGRPGDFTLIKGQPGSDIRLNIESAEYVVAFYYIGRSIYEQLLTAVGENTLQSSNANSDILTVARLGNTTEYYWEQNADESQPTIVFTNFASGTDLNIINPFESIPVSRDITLKHLVEGPLGEVGYKGTFPIFIQGNNVNEVSRIPWRFRGNRTTLGQAGCGLFALMSLIHGAGYGNLGVPINRSKDVTLENLAELIPNGPFLADSVRGLGYQTKTLPTSTKADLDRLFNEVSSGTPYVVNTKYGSIKGVDYKGNEVTTRFTSRGHFILLVGGFEINGVRYVEVVQSTYSFAGTRDIDQNRIAFNWDHLVNNGIIRSSGGSAVPAYTIIGAPNYPTPIYLRENYIPPIMINANRVQQKRSETQDVRPGLQVSYTMDNIRRILTREELTIDGVITSGLDIEIPLDMIVTRSGNDIRIHLDEVTAIEITNVNTELRKITSLYPKGTILGKTTRNSQISTIVREDGDWGELDINSIDVSED